MNIFYLILTLTFILLILIIHVQNNKIKSLEESFQNERKGKTSMAVKHGMLMEQLIPWTKHFDGNPNAFRFLGDPIDGVLFEEDRIIFMEFKTGKSRLSEKQRKIKELVNDKKIFWKEIRVEH